MIDTTWKFAAASVRGSGHELTGRPCQDACSVRMSADGKWLALVASDGAGSAARSEFSSRLVACELSVALIAIATNLEKKAPGAWVTDAVIEEVIRIRERLRHEAGTDDISDFHCTLVAALIGPSGGFAVHLGDGCVFGGLSSSNDHHSIDLAAEMFMSEPENGEYANETFFITERDWVRHLRITPLPAANWLILGTDGGMALAMLNPTTPKKGFVAPVLRMVFSTQDLSSREASLENVLKDPQGGHLTNDDKTLMVAVRARFSDIEGDFAASKSGGMPDPASFHQKNLQQHAPSHSNPACSKRQAPGPNPALSKRAPRSRFLLKALVLVAAVVAIAGALLVFWAHLVAPPLGQALIKGQGGASMRSPSVPVSFALTATIATPQPYTTPAKPLVGDPSRQTSTLAK